MSNRETGGRFADTAIRIRALRRASQWPDRQSFSKNIGISDNTRANIENGLPLSNGTIDLIVRKLPWISSDWLRYGREDALSAAVSQRLAPLLAEERDTTRPRSRSKKSAR
jgi:transcriptional regulator with XRE-family HTH domain